MVLEFGNQIVEFIEIADLPFFETNPRTHFGNYFRSVVTGFTSEVCAWALAESSCGPGTPPPLIATFCRDYLPMSG